MSRSGRLGQRLGRILLLIPYAVRNPGVTIDELCERFDTSRDELLRDLELVFMCGLPGYGPGDLIDVAIEEDRVYIQMADYFSAPLRLTPAEGLALYSGAAALVALPGMEEADALRRALGKLGRAIGEEGSGGVAVEIEGGPAGHLEAIEDALRARRRLRLEYLSSTTGELGEREVDPWGLVTALGRWYLVAYDHSVDDERMFRSDRIKSATMLKTGADSPKGFDPERYRGAFVGEEGRTMTMEISPAAARWFTDYYPVRSERELRGGWRRIEVLAGGERWAATLLLRLGRDVRKVKPESFVEAARRLAQRVAAVYS